MMLDRWSAVTNLSLVTADYKNICFLSGLLCVRFHELVMRLSKTHKLLAV